MLFTEFYCCSANLYLTHKKCIIEAFDLSGSLFHSFVFIYFYIFKKIVRPSSSSSSENQCLCDKNSTEIFEYDNIFKRPICEKKPEAIQESKCPLRFVNAANFSSIRKSVRIFRVPYKEKCICDGKNYENYAGSYCIKNELFKDLKNYQQYKQRPKKYKYA